MDTLGNRIRDARKRRDLTQRKLSAMIGVTGAFLSQVERDHAMPSVVTLQKLASVLEISIGSLMEEPSDRGPVVRKNERPRLLLPYADTDRESLTPGFNHRIQAFAVSMRPGEQSSHHPLSHSSEELLIVLEGVLEIWLDGTTYRLEAGDTILYNGITPHLTKCIGDGSVRYYVINTPPVI